MNTATSTGSQLLITPSLMAIGQTGGGDRIRSAMEPVNTQVSKAETCVIAPNLIQYHSERTEDVRGQAMTGPIMTVDGSNRYGLVSAQLTEYFGNGQPLNVGEPMHTATGKDREALTTANLVQYFGGDNHSQGADAPVNTLTAVDREALILAHLAEFRGMDLGSQAESPLRAIASHDHSSLCLAYAVKFKGDNLGQSVDDPLQTVTAGGGEFGAVYTTVEKYHAGTDLKYWPKVRALLNQYCDYNLADDEVILIWISGIAYFISDIGLRMLTPRELYNAMGFPVDYIIDHDYTGRAYTKSAQVARCGNAVCPPVAGALIKANLAEYALPVYIGTLAELWKAVAV